MEIKKTFMFHMLFYFIEKHANIKSIKKQGKHAHFEGRRNPLDMSHCHVRNN